MKIFSLSIWKNLFQCRLAFSDAVKKSTLNLVAGPWQVTFLLYLGIFIVFSLPLVFCYFALISWGLSFFLFTFFDFMGCSESGDSFLSLILEIVQSLTLLILSILFFMELELDKWQAFSCYHHISDFFLIFSISVSLC